MFFTCWNTAREFLKVTKCFLLFNSKYTYICYTAQKHLVFIYLLNHLHVTHDVFRLGSEPTRVGSYGLGYCGNYEVHSRFICDYR
jgi:hypothetical protein